MRALWQSCGSAGGGLASAGRGRRAAAHRTRAPRACSLPSSAMLYSLLHLGGFPGDVEFYRGRTAGVARMLDLARSRSPVDTPFLAPRRAPTELPPPHPSGAARILELGAGDGRVGAALCANAEYARQPVESPGLAAPQLPPATPSPPSPLRPTLWSPDCATHSGGAPLSLWEVLREAAALRPWDGTADCTADSVASDTHDGTREHGRWVSRSVPSSPRPRASEWTAPCSRRTCSRRCRRARRPSTRWWVGVGGRGRG